MSQASYPVAGVDVGMDTMHVVALDRSGAVAFEARCTRATVLSTLLRLDVELIAMEDCSGAHDRGRRLAEQARPVRLLVATDVRAFVRGQMNDCNDAQAIVDAALRPTVRTVGARTMEQQEIQVLHRVRSLLVQQRTALINPARAMLLESGMAAVHQPVWPFLIREHRGHA